MSGENVPDNYLANIDLREHKEETARLQAINLGLQAVREAFGLSESTELYTGDPYCDYGKIPYNPDVDYLGVYSKE